MSEHWSGLNLAHPCSELTTLGAITPSWYGYYEKAESSWYEYFSPILLLEDCGVSIENVQLDEQDRYVCLLYSCPFSLDDFFDINRYECAALLTRFHYHGWYHGSYAKRNIVMDYGDHTLYPEERARKVKEAEEARKKRQLGQLSDNQRRFRLIDFGRSKWIGDWSSRNLEAEVNTNRTKKLRVRGRNLAEEIRKVDPETWVEWYRECREETSIIREVANISC
jgi:hypothetical protein